jgi:hypothetical protein
LLGQGSVLTITSHGNRTSPVVRGKWVLDNLLGTPPPPPPPNVPPLEEGEGVAPKAMRERMEQHRRSPACAGCHKIMDPIGLGLENFDGVGQFRSTENGADIDASGEIDGIKFTDAASLGKAIHDNPATTACLANSMYRYAVGRDFDPSEREFQTWLGKQFAEKGYRVTDLMKTIATSDAFFAVRASAGAVKEASNNE